jgi:hypothetical protein
MVTESCHDSVTSVATMIIEIIDDHGTTKKSIAFISINVHAIRDPLALGKTRQRKYHGSTSTNACSKSTTSSSKEFGKQ